MATNKRKEAAALFELIDKSTLKVPKHAGALKIPDWWSSKTNPPPPAPPSALATPPVAPSPPSAALAPPAFAFAPPTSSKMPEEVRDTSKPVATVSPVPVQPRLFEPPPADARPGVTPSIRPPAPAFSRPVAVPPQPSPVAPVAPPPEKAAAPAAAPRRQFLPQTMEQSPDTRPQWGGQQRRRMARTPRWAIMAGLLGVVIVVSLIAFLVLSGRRHLVEKSSEPALSTVQQTSGDGGATLLPPVPGRSQAPTAGNSIVPPPPLRQPVTGGLLPPAQPTEEEAPTEPGKVYGPGAVQRAPELYYVRITATPTQSVAKKSADFLASKGIDVSIEIDRKTHLYMLISVRGFATMVEGEPFRKKIVRIGHEHPDFKNYRKVWDDAFLTHVANVGK